MTNAKIDNLILSICGEYKVIVQYDEGFPKDYGECYPEIDKIVLGTKYSNGRIKLAVFLHELGHVITIRRTARRYFAASVFQEESAVWNVAQELCFEYTGRPFSKAQAQFMLRCLDSYSQHQGSFVVKFNKEKPD